MLDPRWLAQGLMIVIFMHSIIYYGLWWRLVSLVPCAFCGPLPLSNMFQAGSMYPWVPQNQTLMMLEHICFMLVVLVMLQGIWPEETFKWNNGWPNQLAGSMAW